MSISFNMHIQSQTVMEQACHIYKFQLWAGLSGQDSRLVASSYPITG